MAEALVGGIYVKEGATLTFEAGISAIMTSTANVVVEGKWQMHPASASIQHILRFTGIDENRFVGGGMDVISGDIGLLGDGGRTASVGGNATVTLDAQQRLHCCWSHQYFTGERSELEKGEI